MDLANKCAMNSLCYVKELGYHSRECVMFNKLDFD